MHLMNNNNNKDSKQCPICDAFKKAEIADSCSDFAIKFHEKMKGSLKEHFPHPETFKHKLTEEEFNSLFDPVMSSVVGVLMALSAEYYLLAKQPPKDFMAIAYEAITTYNASSSMLDIFKNVIENAGIQDQDSPIKPENLN